MTEIYELREKIEELSKAIKLIGDSLWPYKIRSWYSKTWKRNLQNRFLGW